MDQVWLICILDNGHHTCMYMYIVLTVFPDEVIVSISEPTLKTKSTHLQTKFSSFEHGELRSSLSFRQWVGCSLDDLLCHQSVYRDGNYIHFHPGHAAPILYPSIWSSYQVPAKAHHRILDIHRDLCYDQCSSNLFHVSCLYRVVLCGHHTRTALWHLFLVLLHYF